MPKRKSRSSLPILVLLLAAILITGVILVVFNQQPEPTSTVTSLLPTWVQPSPSPSPTPSLPPLPTRKLLTGGTHTFQTFNNCGPAALSMAVSYYGQTVSQQTLGNQLRPFQHPTGNNDDKSVTLAELAQRAAEDGYLTYHRPAGDIELVTRLIAQDMPVITRTWLKTGEDIGHYRVLKGYNQTRQILIQDDSLQGKDLEYSYDEFNHLWQAFNYEFLVLVPAEKKDETEAILGELLDETVAWQQAQQLATSQLDQDPDDIYAGFNLAVAQYHLGEYQAAIDSYEAVSSRLPSRMLWYQVEPLLAYYQVGEYQNVLTLSQRILDNQNRAYSELYWLRGKVFENQGQSSAARSTFDLAAQYNASQYWKINLQDL